MTSRNPQWFEYTGPDPLRFGEDVWREDYTIMWRAIGDTWVDFAVFYDEVNPLPCYTGNVKWDGCTEIYEWAKQGKLSISHFCGMEGVLHFVDLLREFHSIAARELPEYRRYNK